MDVSSQFYALAALPPGKRHDTRRIGGWVGLRAGLDGVAKTKIPFAYRESNPDCSASSLDNILTELSWLS
jgi:hypothetical protein